MNTSSAEVKGPDEVLPELPSTRVFDAARGFNWVSRRRFHSSVVKRCIPVSSYNPPRSPTGLVLRVWFPGLVLSEVERAVLRCSIRGCNERDCVESVQVVALAVVALACFAEVFLGFFFLLCFCCRLSHTGSCLFKARGALNTGVEVVAPVTKVGLCALVFVVARFFAASTADISPPSTMLCTDPSVTPALLARNCALAWPSVIASLIPWR